MKKRFFLSYVALVSLDTQYFPSLFLTIGVKILTMSNLSFLHQLYNWLVDLNLYRYFDEGATFVGLGNEDWDTSNIKTVWSEKAGSASLNEGMSTKFEKNISSMFPFSWVGNTAIGERLVS